MDTKIAKKLDVEFHKFSKKMKNFKLFLENFKNFRNWVRFPNGLFQNTN